MCISHNTPEEAPSHLHIPQQLGTYWAPEFSLSNVIRDFISYLEGICESIIRRQPIPLYTQTLSFYNLVGNYNYLSERIGQIGCQQILRPMPTTLSSGLSPNSINAKLDQRHRVPCLVKDHMQQWRTKMRPTKHF